MYRLFITSLLLVLFSTSKLYSQTNKIESYLIGTKVIFVRDSCGVNLPEADGKLQFCDAANNLGYVEQSTGLMDRGVIFMFENFHNQDEIYLTRNGISIFKGDNQWENIPSFSIPLRYSNGTLVTNATQITGGVRLPNGDLLFGAQSTSTSNSNIFKYDFATKQITVAGVVGEFSAPSYFFYDPSFDVTYVISSSGSSKYLSVFNGATVLSTIELPNSNSFSLSRHTKAFFHDGHIYMPSPQGLVVINPQTINYEIINSTSTPSLAYNIVNDLSFDSQTNNVWIVNRYASDYALSRYDLTLDTIYNYTIPTFSDDSRDYSFQRVAAHANSGWITASNFDGIMSFNLVEDTISITEISKSSMAELGYPYTYSPNHIFFKNYRYYFSTLSTTSGIDTNYEVLIHDMETAQWTGRNDDATGNRSYQMNKRFEFSKPDTSGGLWWFNPLDDVVVYRDDDDNEYLQNPNFNLHYAAINHNNLPLVFLNLPRGMNELNTDTTNILGLDINSVSSIHSYGNQTWVHTGDRSNLVVIEDNAITESFVLDESFSNYYTMSLDSYGKVWFFRSGGNTTFIRQFDPITESFVEYDTLPYIGSPYEIVHGPQGSLLFLGSSGVLFYKSEEFSHYEHRTSVLGLNKPQTAVFDSNGTMYCLQNDPAEITKIAYLGTDSVAVMEHLFLEGINTVLPAVDFYRPSALSIDQNGAIWTNASLQTIKIIDSDFTPQYRTKNRLNVISSVQSDVKSEDRINFEIYPNPTRDDVFIRTNCLNFLATISDGRGTALIETNKSQIDISSLPAGFYFITLKNDTYTSTKIILKE